ncbi:MAG: helix-turn-helix domain-containing protein [Vicinamibacterales bacterium]
MLNARTAPPSGESTLDARLCAELGAELTRAREARGLTITQVGERLLLSTRQVRALETVDFAAFHNASFHLGALRKYVQFAALDERLINQIASSLVRPDPQAVMLVPSDSSDDASESSSGRMLSIVGTIVALAIVAAGAYYLAQSRARSASPAPAVVTPIPTPAPAPPPAAPVVSAPEPEAAPATDSSPTASASTTSSQLSADTQGFGTLRAQHPTWIFVRDVDNAVTERSLAEGETFTIESQPTYLAVGTTDAELTIGTRRIDVARFVTNGQIRIRAGDFDALVQDVSPIQAPTPVGRP